TRAESTPTDTGAGSDVPSDDETAEVTPDGASADDGAPADDGTDDAVAADAPGTDTGATAIEPGGTDTMVDVRGPDHDSAPAGDSAAADADRAADRQTNGQG
ncbi:MAG TPA: hypothetical protein VJM49_05265, partial [Acidimicrobiales bacterium]|nr:hypothetical protein [Acidimicrobiales bacterium]